MNTPHVSVLMTAYNREKYIAEAIQSVIDSTYENWELIIVDDRSKDNTVAIAKEYEKRDSRIKVYINEKNLGDYPNRNKAASYAKGKYLKYVDADDLIYPHGLEVMVRALESFPEAGFSLALPASDFTPYPQLLSPKEAYEENFLVKPIFIKSPLGAIIKREAFENVGGFSGKRMIGDEELWLKLASKYHLVKMVMGTAFWRAHSEQESNDINLYIAERFKINMQMLQSVNCPLTDELKTKAIKMHRNGYIRNKVLKKQLFRGKLKCAMILASDSNLSLLDIFKSLLKL